MWRKEAVPQDFKDASIIHLLKRKGNTQVCDNHRGISIFLLAWKILARVLLNRFSEHLEQLGLLPKSQCAFWNDSGKIGMIFAARQLQEKRQEYNVDLWMTFVDITKAFDTVSHEGLETYSKVCLSGNGATVPRWYACTGLKRLRVFWFILCDKWS